MFSVFLFSFFYYVVCPDLFLHLLITLTFHSLYWGTSELNAIVMQTWSFIRKCVTTATNRDSSSCRMRPDLTKLASNYNMLFTWKILPILFSPFSVLYIFITVSHSTVQFIRNSRRAAFRQHGQHNRFNSTETIWSPGSSSNQNIIQMALYFFVKWILIEFEKLNAI